MLHYKPSNREANRIRQKVMTMDAALVEFNDGRLQKYVNIIKQILAETGINIDVYIDDKACGNNTLGGYVSSFKKMKLYKRKKPEPFVIIFLTRIERSAKFSRIYIDVVDHFKTCLMHELVHAKDHRNGDKLGHGKRLPSTIGKNNLNKLSKMLNISS